MGMSVSWLRNWRRGRVDLFVFRWSVPTPGQKGRHTFKRLKLSIGLFPGHACVGGIIERPDPDRVSWMMTLMLIPFLGVRMRYREIISGYPTQPRGR